MIANTWFQQRYLTESDLRRSKNRHHFFSVLMYKVAEPRKPHQKSIMQYFDGDKRDVAHFILDRLELSGFEKCGRFYRFRNRY